MKVAFFDRDGTVIQDYADQEWKDINKPEFLPYAIESMQQVSGLGYKIIFISNQYLINDGIITDSRFQRVNNMFLNTLKRNGVEILDFYYCPHSEKEGCKCKKPKPGMILKALEEYPEIDLKSSFYVGDSEADIGISKYFDLEMFYLGKLNETTNQKKVFEIKDLQELVTRLKNLISEK